MDITRLDPAQQLAFDASHPVRGAHPVAILGNLSTADFELVQLGGEVPDLREKIVARQLSFIGVVGIVQGVPKSALEVPLDNATIAALSGAYIKLIENSLNARLETDELYRMFAKPSEYDA